jgi:hypothetical protein
MNLKINTVLRSKKPNGEFLLERIIWIDEGNIICFVINIDEDANEYPILRKISEINEGIEEELITIEEDSYVLFVHPSDITEEQKKYRDNAWDVIKDIVICEPEIYNKMIRGKMVREIQEKKGIGSHNTVNKYLKRYWRRGKVKNALIDDRDNCGGRGKPKTLGEKKFGKGNKINIGTGEGINVTQEIKDIFEVGYYDFYTDKKKLPLSKVFNLILEKYFGESYYTDNGVEQVFLYGLDERPTMRQFRYWCENHPDIKKTIIKRKGIREYNLKYRERQISTNFTVKTYGPGVRFQIDATVCDFYLKSSFNDDWIIGRPVLYFLTDVFSRMIVGYYVGLEGPSWIGMMMAIANAAIDKVKHCKKYKIEISPDEWDVRCVPQFLVGDNGELKGKPSAGLTDGLNVTIEYAAPFRGDFKPIVERAFGVFHGETKPFVPGYVDKDHNKRGGSDYRLDKKLDLDAFNRIIIRYILSHNNKRRISKFERTEEMIMDDVQPIPREIWNWGMGKDFSKPKVFDERTIKLNLMPSGKATVTRDGISFKKMLYTCDEAKRENWFDKAFLKGKWKVDISYDPRNMNIIYIRKKGRDNFITCTLKPNQEKYMDKSILDIEYLRAKESYDEKVSEHEQLENQINSYKELQHIVDEELNEYRPTPNISKAERLSGLNVKRQQQKEKLREQEAWALEEPILAIDELDVVQDEIIETTHLEKLDNSFRQDNSLKSLLKRKHRERLDARG